ncbi:MAG: ATP-binding protein [Acidimicrobiales bacterium]|nr:ATP-binding protein [Acidimicrobiales bacterium]
MSSNEHRGQTEDPPFDTLLGRTEVRASILGALDGLGAGRSTEGILIEGLRESGRSILLWWAAEQARGRRWLTAAVRVQDDGVDALWDAAADLAGELGRLRPGALAVRALQEALGAPPGELVAACRAFARLIGDAADECRTTALVTVDDADRWGGSGGAALGQLFGPARRSMPLLVVAARLPGAVVPGDPVHHRLGPLTLADLATEPWPGFDEAALRRLRESSGGWPSVIKALLAESPENWALEAHDYFEQITAALLPGERRYLESVALLAGTAIPIGLVAKALGDSTRFSDESSTLTGIRQSLLKKGLLYAPEEGHVDIALAGYREHLGQSRDRR